MSMLNAWKMASEVRGRTENPEERPKNHEGGEGAVASIAAGEPCRKRLRCIQCPAAADDLRASLAGVMVASGGSRKQEGRN